MEKLPSREEIEMLKKTPKGRKNFIELVSKPFDAELNILDPKDPELAKKNVNWQCVPTPYDICHEMIDQVKGAENFLVFFSMEFLEVIIHEFNYNPESIKFVADTEIEARMASDMYLVKSVVFGMDNKVNNQNINKLGDDMKFGKLAVVGNPPYQLSNDTTGKTTHASALYDKFVETVIDGLNPDYFTFIIPSRWMVGGRGLDSHRKRMMNDRRMKKIVHFTGEREVFPTVSIKGGVNYFAWEKNYNGECEFVHGNTSVKRFLNTHDIILQDNNAVGILDKVQSIASVWMNKSWSGQTPFGVVSSFNNWQSSGVKCIKVGNEEKFINQSDFSDKHGIMEKWKVCTSKATSEGNINPDKSGAMAIATNFFMIEPNAICTQTYIVVNVFDTKKEAENFISYMKTKFFRFMLGLRVLTMDINKEKFAWVPDMMDYSAPWTDKELYAHFGLTRQEQAYIESKIKAI